MVIMELLKALAYSLYNIAARNKLRLGTGILAAFVYVQTDAQFDAYPKARLAAGLAAAFLIGAGGLKSDSFYRDNQKG